MAATDPWRLGGHIARGLAAAALYLAFAAKLQGPEWLIAGLAGALAAMSVFLLRRVDGRPQVLVRPPVHWLAKLMGNMVSDSVVVAVALAQNLFGRATTGSLRTVGFKPGDDKPRAVSRRTWVTLGKSLTPNGVVIVVDRPHERLLVHELVAADPACAAVEWPT